MRGKSTYKDILRTIIRSHPKNPKATGGICVITSDKVTPAILENDRGHNNNEPITRTISLNTKSLNKATTDQDIHTLTILGVYMYGYTSTAFQKSLLEGHNFWDSLSGEYEQLTAGTVRLQRSDYTDWGLQCKNGEHTCAIYGT